MALTKFEQTGDAATEGSSDEFSAGNGSIMRLAPVPTFFTDLYPDRAAELIRYGHDSSLATHRIWQATSAAAYMMLLQAALMEGESRVVVLSPNWHVLDILFGTVEVHPGIRESSKVASAESHRRSRVRAT